MAEPMAAQVPSVPEVPVVRLDPSGADHHGEAARMRALGPVVRAVLPGGVRMWAVTEHALLAELVTDPRVSRDWHHWEALRRGEIPADWPLLNVIRIDSVMSREGAAHQRLRRPLTRTLTRRRVEALRPRIEEIVAALLDELPRHARPDGVVELREHFAYPFPMRVICELIGVPEPWWPRFRRLIDGVVRANTTAEETGALQRERHELWSRLIEMRRAAPTGDLTSALLAVGAEDGDPLTDRELEDTLWMLIGAGHETTLGLMLNATRALLTHPERLSLVRAGGADAWSGVVEETLRWDAPVGNFPARYPLEDITIAGITIPKGDAILAPFSGVGRDPRRYGPDAGRFDPARPAEKHLAFGGGPHVCLGAHLARMEVMAALPALFGRYPGLRLAVDAAELPPVPSFVFNSTTSLPVHLGGPGAGP
ncbi:cytochrome P450 family protein [Actinomadura oligospora]|uniref:cytochrome P450 family protein n=1 Tax=Actinomadura oligospora TaxID=111804 RepID=UPI0004B3270D|nr:cytochrome P450 [Actinomadura oligospora]